MPNLDDYIHITEAAKYLGVCINTLRNWEADGNPVVTVEHYQLDAQTILKQANKN